MKYVHLIITDDDTNVTPIDGQLIVKNDDDAHYALRGYSIGQITNNSNNFFEPELESALMAATMTVRAEIHKQFLSLSAWKPWTVFPNLLKIALASDSVFLIFDRPDNCARLTFTQTQIAEEWTQIINKAQDIFELRGGYVSTGSPHGGSIHYGYKLK
jgi:hypothetical protein